MVGALCGMSSHLYIPITSSFFFISYKTTGHCLGQHFFSFLSSTCEFQIRARSTLFTYWLKPFFLGEDYSHELESLSKESSILLKTILGDNTFYFQMRYKSFCFSKKYLINFKRSQSILVGSSINLVFVNWLTESDLLNGLPPAPLSLSHTTPLLSLSLPHVDLGTSTCPNIIASWSYHCWAMKVSFVVVIMKHIFIVCLFGVMNIL